MSLDAPEIETSIEMETTARDIYKGLVENKGKATLFGVHAGNVYLDAPYGKQRELQVNRTVINSDSDNYDKNLYRNTGFSDEDIASGIISIYEAEAPASESIQRVVNENPRPTRTIFVSGLGKAIERVPDTKLEDEVFRETELDDYIKDGLQRLSYLSDVPHTILKTFGSYDRFKQALGAQDMGFIEDHETNIKTTPFYSSDQGRLKDFVERMSDAEHGVYPQKPPTFFISEHIPGDFKTFFDQLKKSTDILETKKRTQRPFGGARFERVKHHIRSITRPISTRQDRGGPSGRH